MGGERVNGTRTARVTVRGQRATLIVEPITLLVAALLALEDDRVDAVLRSFKVGLVDADGDQVWPESDRRD